MSLKKIITDAAKRGADIDEDDIEDDRRSKMVQIIEAAIANAILKGEQELGDFSDEEIDDIMNEVANVGGYR
jgi:hypothetical protein